MLRRGMIAGGPVTLESLIAAESPVLWLKLDETSGSTAYDSSGNGRDCAISGCTFDANGVIFSANSSTISRTDANLRIGADNSWCMSAIVTVTSTSGGSGIRNLMTYWHDEYGGSQNCTLYLTNGICQGKIAIIQIQKSERKGGIQSRTMLSIQHIR